MSVPDRRTSSAPPPRSPFGSGPVMQSVPIAESHAVSGSVALAATLPEATHAGSVIPFRTPQPRPSELETIETSSDPAELTVPQSVIAPPAAPPNTPRAPAEGLTPQSVQQAIVSGLAQNGHASASTLLSTARLTLEATSLRIEVPGIGKKMLALTVNAAA